VAATSLPSCGGSLSVSLKSLCLSGVVKRRRAFDLHFIFQFHTIENVKSKDAIEALGALASEARLAVFRLLVKRGPQGYTPTDLVERLRLPAPTLSFHLKELAHAQLVASRRDGRNLYYSANFERMSTLIGFLTDNCCSMADEACDTNCQPLAAVAQRKRA
jgi:ArsR family transcriptional regulator